MRACVRACVRRLVGLERSGDHILELALEENVPPFTGTNVSRTGETPMCFGALLEEVRRHPPRALVAVAHGGERRRVVESARFAAAQGAGNGQWQVLLTAVPVQDAVDC